MSTIIYLRLKDKRFSNFNLNHPINSLKIKGDRLLTHGAIGYGKAKAWATNAAKAVDNKVGGVLTNTANGVIDKVNGATNYVRGNILGVRNGLGSSIMSQPAITPIGSGQAVNPANQKSQLYRQAITNRNDAKNFVTGLAVDTGAAKGLMNTAKSVANAAIYDQGKFITAPINYVVNTLSDKNLARSPLTTAMNKFSTPLAVAGGDLTAASPVRLSLPGFSDVVDAATSKATGVADSFIPLKAKLWIRQNGRDLARKWNNSATKDFLENRFGVRQFLNNKNNNSNI